MTEPLALTEPEVQQFLEDAAFLVPRDRAIVEVGVFQGSTLTALGRGAKAGFGAHVYGVDVWGIRGAQTSARYGDQCLPIVLRSLANHGLYDVSLVRDLSVKVADRWYGPKIGLLFIDGDHREVAVRADWEAWQPHLAPDALVVFDDYWPGRFDGVVRAVDEFFPSGVTHCGPRTVWTRMS